MGTMTWLRWYHGTTDDPKFRAIAEDSGQSLVTVLAVWAKMLETASMAEERGRLIGWRDRVVAAALCITTDAVSSIREAMQGLVLDGDRLTGWRKRQPEREDPSAAERQRRHRAAVRAEDREPEISVSRPVTQGHAPDSEGDSESNPSDLESVAAREAKVVSLDEARLNSDQGSRRADARPGSAGTDDRGKAIRKEHWRHAVMAEAQRTMSPAKLAQLWAAQMQDPVPAWAIAELNRLDLQRKKAHRHRKSAAGAVAA